MGLFDSFKKNKKSGWEKFVEKYKPGKELVKPSEHIIPSLTVLKYKTPFKPRVLAALEGIYISF